MKPLMFFLGIIVGIAGFLISGTIGLGLIGPDGAWSNIIAFGTCWKKETILYGTKLWKSENDDEYKSQREYKYAKNLTTIFIR